MALAVFTVLFVMSFFLLSAAGDYWPWYAVTAAIAVVPVVVGPLRYRLIGTAALALSLVLIIGDYGMGKQRRARQQSASATPTICHSQYPTMQTYIRHSAVLN